MFLVGFLASLLLVAAGIAGSRSEGLLNEGGVRLVGGSQGERTQFPWQVYLEGLEGGAVVTRCSGSLISQDFVLTSAQCVHRAENVKLYIGAYDLTKTREPGRVTLESSDFTVHELFEPSVPWPYDIAVVRLPRTISTSAYITPIRTQPEFTVDTDLASPFVGWLSRVSGWRDASGVLRYADVAVVERAVCDSSMGATFVPEQICGISARGHGPCQSDLGSPLVVQEVDGSFTQVGLFSVVNSLGCTKGAPTGYTALWPLLSDWLANNADLD